MTAPKVGTIEYLKDVPLYGDEIGSFAVTRYSDKDIPLFKENFESWVKHRELCLSIGGRAPNLCDAFTEGMYCLYSGSVRYVKVDRRKAEYKAFGTEKLSNASIDTYSEKNKEGEQIKSSIILDDCTSFGPTSKQDALYFMHFYRDGKPLDGSFDLYRIENDLLYSTVIKNDGTTFAEKQKTGQRPHFSLLKKVILPNNIQPVEKNVKLW